MANKIPRFRRRAELPAIPNCRPLGLPTAAPRQDGLHQLFRHNPTGGIPMPNHAKCGPAKPVSANLKLPQARRLQRRPLRLRPAVVWMQPTPERSDGIISGAGNYCLLTGCGTNKASKLHRVRLCVPLNVFGIYSNRRCPSMLSARLFIAALVLSFEPIMLAIPDSKARIVSYQSHPSLLCLHQFSQLNPSG